MNILGAVSLLALGAYLALIALDKPRKHWKAPSPLELFSASVVGGFGLTLMAIAIFKLVF